MFRPVISSGVIFTDLKEETLIRVSLFILFYFYLFIYLFDVSIGNFSGLLLL